MTWSTSFYHKLIAIVVLFCACAGCAGQSTVVKPALKTEQKRYRVAVFPVENLSGGKAPLKELRQILEEQVKGKGFQVLSEAAMNQFMARHRIRYVGGVDEESSNRFAEEEGVQGVLISSLEYYADNLPPKIAITARLVSTGTEPRILWMESVALGGNDTPGLFQSGVIREASKLSEKALARLVQSLAENHAADFVADTANRPNKGFPPRQFFRKGLDPDKRFQLVVLPFYNRTGRKYAGEIMALHFVQELRRLGNFQVVEPGLVRNKLLQYRLIMEGGMSNANADIIFDVLQANGVVTGKTMDYQDARGESGIPSVDFSASILSKESHMTVLSASSYNNGDERVHFFDIGRISTACELANQMIRGVVFRLRTPEKIMGAE